MELYYEHEADEIYVRHIREENADGNGYTMHIHERCEIYYFIDGNADYLVEGSEYRMKRGSLLVMRPGEVHRAKLLANGIYERYAVNFPISLFDDIDPERRLTNLYTDRPLGINNLYEKPELEYLFEQLCEDHTDEYDRRLTAYRILIEILSKLGNEFTDRTPFQAIYRSFTMGIHNSQKAHCIKGNAKQGYVGGRNSGKMRFRGLFFFLQSICQKIR